MATKKVFILIPDGVGIRNFAFGNFAQKAKAAGLDITYWNNSSFELSKLGLKELKTPKPEHHALTDSIKRVKIENYMESYAEEFEDPAYLLYKFNNPVKSSIKDWIKNRIHRLFKWYLIGPRKQYAQVLINYLEKKTPYFGACLSQLEEFKPDFVFCTNQRPLTAVAPIEAAKFLNIPTGTFIFSWDNLPKATMVIDPEHYFVWSDFMKNELIKYNPEITENSVTVTGTPQFEIYRDPDLLNKKEEFRDKYGLEEDVKYICFSGDDHTTSPYDEFYLRDLAKTVLGMNQKSTGVRYGILFRKCPVDKSNRYDPILKEFGTLIISIDPKWEAAGEAWNQIMPMPEDNELLVNTVHHSHIVLNVASSMVFDFYSMGKPCCYFNYDPVEADPKVWTIKRVNQFIHFRSMPSKEAVLWINSFEDIEIRLRDYFTHPATWNQDQTKTWFETVISQPIDQASENICAKINQLIS